MRKLSSAATGRLKPLRLFSTLLPIALICVQSVGCTAKKTENESK